MIPNKLLSSLNIKRKSLGNELLFERLGLPKVKNEKISKSILRKYLPSNPTIVDCGAHDGTDSILLAKILRGQVHAFEPVPNLYAQLCSNTKNYSINCYQLALFNIATETEMYISGGSSNASSSLLKPKTHLEDHPNVSFEQKAFVRTDTLDNWANTNMINKVDLLWLDMQGSEYSMLKESKIILPSVSVIHTEVSTKETYEGTYTYKVLRDFLGSQGFSVAIEAIPKGADMGNVLFVKT